MAAIARTRKDQKKIPKLHWETMINRPILSVLKNAKRNVKKTCATKSAANIVRKRTDSNRPVYLSIQVHLSFNRSFFPTLRKEAFLYILP